MGKNDNRTEALRRRIEEQMARQEKDRQEKFFAARINLVREGMLLYSKRKFPEAVQKFQSYLRTLEEHKGCGEGELHPKYFDKEKDVSELLMISAVYWDLSKIYDRTKSPDKQKDFQNYLNKYVLFSKGMPFETVSAEGLRKYIFNEKPIHKSPFKNAYKALGGGDCFLVTAVSDLTEQETLPRFRRYRDQVLNRSIFGRGFIWAYYRVGPTLAWGVERLPAPLRVWLARFFDRLARKMLI